MWPGRGDSRHSENHFSNRHRTSPEWPQANPNAAVKGPRPPKGPAGELRPAGATTHGATSKGKQAPLRAKHRAELRERFPLIDQQRLQPLSDLLARIDLATDFLDVNGLIRNTHQAHPVLDLLTRWKAPGVGNAVAA